MYPFVRNVRIMICDMKVIIKPFTKECIAKTFEWVSDTDLQKQFFIRGEPTWEGHEIYFERILADSMHHIFAIIVEGDHVGNCGVKNMLPMKKEGELWIYIGEASMRGKGIGKYATELLLHEGFQVLGLETIYVHVADFNDAALKMYKCLGFIKISKLGEINSDWVNRGCEIIRMELKKN